MVPVNFNNEIRILERGALNARRLSNQYIREQASYKALPDALESIVNGITNNLTEVMHFILDNAFEAEGDFKPGTLVKPAKKPIKAAYQEGLKKSYLTGADEIVKFPQVELDKLPISKGSLNSIIADRVFRASDFTMQRLTGEVLPTIKQGIIDGLPYNTTLEELRPQFEDMADWQLRRIAVTETHSTYNQAKQETLEKSIAPGKRWLASGLPNTREWHEEADGQTVATEDSFMVMDEPLLYPGDPEGSPENIINCRCTMVPDVFFKG